MGDLGSGKTTALVSHFWQWIDQGIDSSQILILAGHRYRHAQLFREALLHKRQQVLGPLELKVFPGWGRELIENYLPLIDPRPFVLLHSPETLFLMRQFYEQQGHRFFGQVQADKFFFRHLLRRQRRCAENMLHGVELNERSELLEEFALAGQANAFLAAFSQWLDQQSPRLLDITNQMHVLIQLAQEPIVKQACAHYHYCLSDDLDETRPLEQFIYQALLRPREWVSTGNSQGSIERLLGADPGYLSRLSEDSSTQVIYLSQMAPQWELAHKFSALLQHQVPEKTSLNLAKAVQYLQHPSQMIEMIGNQILALRDQGLALDQVVCLSWYLDDLSLTQLTQHLEQLQIPCEVFRGGETMQRHPMLNTLLSLLRLALWEHFRHDKNIARLTGFDMAQIYRLCGDIDPFQLAPLRLALGDDLEAWGQALKQVAHSNPAIQQIQDVLAQIRRQYPQAGLANLYEVALLLWQTLLLPRLQAFDQDALRLIHQFLDLLERYAQIQAALKLPEGDQALMRQFLQQETLSETEIPTNLENGKVKIMTLFRLCELRYESDYQIWFDLTSPSWNRPINHPIDNSLLLSRAWNLEERWSLEAEDRYIDERLAAMIHKGLQYCRKEPSFFACHYDALAQFQAFERLREIASFRQTSLSES